VTTLDKLVAERPELTPAATLLRALLRAMADVTVSLPRGIPDADAARVRVDAGVPALEGEPLLDAAALVAAARTIGERLAAEGGSDAGIRMMPELERALTGPDGGTFTHGALAAAWDDIADAITSAAPEIDEQTLVTLLDYASRPTLRAAAAALRDVIDDARWTRGSCPGCGAPPVLAELRAPSSGGERERYLRCGRCASAWLYPRIGCPGCGTTDHRSLRYLHGEGEDEFRRAMTCDNCHGYVKEIAVLDPLPPDGLLEEDLATVALDLMALERGYRRASPS
jgi:FdhE protein